MTDRSLEDAIFHLRRSNPDQSVQKVVDEAAKLMAQGRQIEAGALIEKAEAMSGVNGRVEENVRAEANGHAHENSQEKVMNRINEKLAGSLAEVLAGAFHELEQHMMDEGKKLTQSFQHQIDKLQTTVESLGALKESLSSLADTVSQHKAATASQEQHNKLAAEVAQLHKGESRHDADIADIRHKAGQMAAEINKHQAELAALKTAVTDRSEKIISMIETIDKQSEVIRSLNEAETRRAAALEQALGVFAQLSTPLKARAQGA
jgi:archaellum component FlaC